MNSIRHWILALSLAALVIGCQKGGDAVESTSKTPPSSPSASQSAGVSAQSGSDETLSKDRFTKAHLIIQCASETLGSELEPADIRSRVLENFDITAEAYRRAEEAYVGETFQEAFDARMDKWCTAERARQKLGATDELE